MGWRGIWLGLVSERDGEWADHIFLSGYAVLCQLSRELVGEDCCEITFLPSSIMCSAPAPLLFRLIDSYTEINAGGLSFIINYILSFSTEECVRFGDDIFVGV